MRETSDPVCVRVKNASGCRRTCRNTLARSSSTRLSPIHAEYHDFTYSAPAPSRPSPATASASVTTTFSRSCRMPSSMISRKISGLTTTMAEPTAVIPSSSTICPRYRRRYGQTRRTVPGRTLLPGHLVVAVPKHELRTRDHGSTITPTPHRAASHFSRRGSYEDVSLLAALDDTDREIDVQAVTGWCDLGSPGPADCVVGRLPGACRVLTRRGRVVRGCAALWSCSCSTRSSSRRG